jgi:SAM-dependent methyltransferase
MKSLDESIIESLDGSDIGIKDFIPYILQDLWEFGSDPETMVELIRDHVDIPIPNIMDLGCGKGAVSIRIAQEINCAITGIDAVPEFIQEAKEYAMRYKVNHRCNFEVGDIRDKIKELTGFDIVILGAIGPILGDLKTTLRILKGSLIAQGFVLLDDGYIEDSSAVDYNKCLRKNEFYKQIKDAGFRIIHEEIFSKEMIEESDDKIFNSIKKRVNELSKKHPDKSEMFNKYLENQDYENKMLETSIITGTWLLKNYDTQHGR